ncbi:MAG: glycosyltransferase family 2 protein [Oscillospiraceae bacterium]|nr:glycosyltransferase family 2 protein [Oscillospiraceae bacterium]
MERKLDNNPLISVVMPAYNAQKFIEEAINSVIAQTYSNWELIVIDDCSSDGTCKTAEGFAASDLRIKLIKNEVNMNVAKTRNRGFDLCSGEYVALLDSDDVWYPEKLEKQLKAALDSSADVVYCSYEIIDTENAKACNDFIVPETTDFDTALYKSVISCSTVLLSKEIVGNYRFETDFYHEDLALWLKILGDGYSAVGVTDVLAKYRLVQGSRAYNKINSAIGRWKIYRDYLNLPLLKSIWAFAKYMVLGLKKYKSA